ncbi:hypothetical protein LIA77_05400 [Sarocladium implicatum]|nr:hypothetical protein LIA77_05400 [Sarocladium implicatum]
MLFLDTRLGVATNHDIHCLHCQITCRSPCRQRLRLVRSSCFTVQVVHVDRFANDHHWFALVTRHSHQAHMP